MGLEAATYIHQLNQSNPVGAVDPKAQGDDHLRLIKTTLQNTFLNITGAVTATQAQLNAGATVAAQTVDVDVLAATAGAADTFLRTDARLKLSQAIAPNWSANHTWLDGVEVRLGTGGDLKLSHSGTESEINNATGPLYIRTTGNFIFIEPMGSENPIVIGNYKPGLPYNYIDLRHCRIDDTLGDIALNTDAHVLGQLVADDCFRAGDGTTATPSYNFINATNSGMYVEAGSTNLRFAAAGQQVLAATATALIPLKQMLHIDGTQAAPSYSFGSEPGTGFYYTAAGDISYSASNSRTVRLCSVANGSLQVADPSGALQTVGYRNIPQNSQSANYGLVADDAGKHVLHPNGAGAGDTFTIPANATIAYPIGTVLTFVNRDSNSLSIAITSDTMILAGTTTTGARTLSQNGIATAIKVEATTWLISGTGLS
jgi:hypothetical protein